MFKEREGPSVAGVSDKAGSDRRYSQKDRQHLDHVGPLWIQVKRPDVILIAKLSLECSKWRRAQREGMASLEERAHLLSSSAISFLLCPVSSQKGEIHYPCPIFL